MEAWRDKVPGRILRAWDRLGAAAGKAGPFDGLPDGVGHAGVVEAVMAVAEAKGLLRRDVGSNGAIDLTMKEFPGAIAVVALTTGRIGMWAAAVRAVAAMGEAAAGEVAALRAAAEGGDDGAGRIPPLVDPGQSAMLARRVTELEDGVRRGRYVRRLYRPGGAVAGIAWIPEGTGNPEGFGPGNIAEWDTPAGVKGLYVPLVALPDVLVRLGAKAGALVAARSPGSGPVAEATLLAAPGHEADARLATDLRLGARLEATAILGLLEKWARGAREAETAEVN
ncbi:MAG: hypothetical protein FJ087_11400 [Deltaproteobacteria bacterium]|nr:hypothetical protein [Deltaproteobacteria bacterium]